MILGSTFSSSAPSVAISYTRARIALAMCSGAIAAASPNLPRKPPPSGVGRNRRVKSDDLMEFSQKVVENLLEK